MYNISFIINQFYQICIIHNSLEDFFNSDFLYQLYILMYLYQFYLLKIIKFITLTFFHLILRKNILFFNYSQLIFYLLCYWSYYLKMFKMQIKNLFSLFNNIIQFLRHILQCKFFSLNFKKLLRSQNMLKLHLFLYYTKYYFK